MKNTNALMEDPATFPGPAIDNAGIQAQQLPNQNSDECPIRGQMDWLGWDSHSPSNRQPDQDTDGLTIYERRKQLKFMLGSPVTWFIRRLWHGRA
jgi:hypothetical protein